MDVKEEYCFLGFSSPNERDTKDLVQKVRIETVTSSSNIKPEVEDSTCSESKEHYVLRFNEAIKESEIETKIDIKEEDWWLKKEDAYINDGIKDETNEDFYATKPPSLYKKDLSNYTSDLVFSEDSGKNMSFNMNKDCHERETDRKYQGQKSVAVDISSVEASICSETPSDGKIVSITSSLKQSKLLRLSNTNKQDIYKQNCKSNLSHEYRNFYECDISQNCLKYPSDLEKHGLAIDSKEANKRDVGDNGLNQLSAKIHNLIDDGKTTHKCNICNKAFTQSSNLKSHKLIHEGIKPHKCNICNKAFTQLSNLKRHTRIHEGIKPHKCIICNKDFTQLSHLKTHKLIHEGIKPHKCNMCNKAFTDSAKFKKHKLIHEGIQPHKCNICSKAFTEFSSLKRHCLVHKGIKPHKCNICNKAFTQLSNLKTHKLIHEGIKSHKCNMCNKAFTESAKLKKHKLFHEGIQPHKCNICSKAFTELSSLKRHHLVHKGIKPHNCNICSKAFTDISSLKRHKLVHEGIKPNKCNV